MKATINLIYCLFLCFLATCLQAQNFEWAKSFGGSSLDAGYSLAIDDFGNIYITGLFSDTVDFDPGVNTYNMISKGSYDIYVSKFDTAGNFIWAKSFGGTSSDYGKSINADTYGNVYITGYFNDTVDFDPNSGIYNLVSKGETDVFVCKLNASGNLIWAKQMGGTGFDKGNSITVDTYGNVFTTGTFSDTVDFDPGSGTCSLTSLGGGDVFISKLDSSGNFIWAKQFGGIYAEDVYSIAVDTNENVYTTGGFQGTADFDPGINTYNLTSIWNFDAFVQKLDASGNFLWAKQFGGYGSVYAYSIATDALGNVYSIGRFQDTVDFDPGVDVYNLVSISYNQDIFISKLDTLGDFLWAKQIGGNLGGDGNSITTDASGNVYSTGLFMDTVDFDPGISEYIMISEGGPDIFVNKLDPAGNFLWAEQMSGTGINIGNDIKIDALGNIYTIGSFQDTVDFDPGSGIYNLTSTAHWDIYIHKMSQVISEINEPISDSQIRYYPNPTNGRLNIVFEKEQKYVKIIVRNLMGQELFCENHTTNSHINLTLDGEPGIYFIEINADNKRAFLKVIKD